MLALAQGLSSWLHPTVWGQTLPLDAPLAYWMGAWAIGLAPSWLSAGSAARIPFALLSRLLLRTWCAGAARCFCFWGRSKTQRLRQNDCRQRDARFDCLPGPGLAVSRSNAHADAVFIFWLRIFGSFRPSLPPLQELYGFGRGSGRLEF